MAKKTSPNKKKQTRKQIELEKREQAMVEGILEGSPDGIGVVVIRLDCGCRKMAAVSRDGEPASKVIMYRDGAERICDLCQEDQGAYARITRQFIHWQDDSLSLEQKRDISFKVMGTTNDGSIEH